MRIDLSTNIDEVIGWTGRLASQFEFACAVALTKTIKGAQKDFIQEGRARTVRSAHALHAQSVPREDCDQAEFVG